MCSLFPRTEIYRQNDGLLAGEVADSDVPRMLMSWWTLEASFLEMPLPKLVLPNQLISLLFYSSVRG